MDASRLQRVGDMADSVQADGLSGFLTALPRMIGPGADISGCISDADFCMNDAGSEEEFWDCAVDMAVCVRDARVDVEPPEPPEPPDPPDPPDDGDDRWPRDPATLALAALLFQLRRDRGYEPAASSSGGPSKA